MGARSGAFCVAQCWSSIAGRFHSAETPAISEKPPSSLTCAARDNSDDFPGNDRRRRQFGCGRTSGTGHSRQAPVRANFRRPACAHLRDARVHWRTKYPSDERPQPGCFRATPAIASWHRPRESRNDREPLPRQPPRQRLHFKPPAAHSIAPRTAGKPVFPRKIRHFLHLRLRIQPSTARAPVGRPKSCRCSSPAGNS